jgi:hypothetical protein
MSQVVAEKSIEQSGFLENLNNPIVTGWKLGIRSLKELMPYLAAASIICAVVISFSTGLVRTLFGEGTFLEIYERNRLGLLSFSILWAAIFYAPGVIVSQILVSRRYTGLVLESPVKYILRRYFPWLFTYVMILVIAFIGFFLIIGTYQFTLYLTSDLTAEQIANPPETPTPLGYILLSLIGLGFLLIIPGFYCALRFFYADEYALIHCLGPFRALRESWYLTKGKMWRIISFQFLLGIANIIVLAPIFVCVISLLTYANLNALAFVNRVIFFLVFWILYTLSHAPEVVYFYGLRASKEMLDSAD